MKLQHYIIISMLPPTAGFTERSIAAESIRLVRESPIVSTISRDLASIAVPTSFKVFVWARLIDNPAISILITIPFFKFYEFTSVYTTYHISENSSINIRICFVYLA